ncbi:hypothetical protein PTQ33_01380 [Campylobacter sp. 50012-21]|uniref:hypothetical protein n=1 Tax=Campylobacter magnus TaxID=3026462 RepID=UPI0023625289|nr:hypothetical protein [Campylobacter magnus]MDD0845778.1 hypothetical protein [Campylobacter magnus]
MTIFLKLLLFCCYFKKFVFKAKKYKPYEVVILSKFIIDVLLNISFFARSLLGWECSLADGIKDDLSTFAKAKGYGAWDEV